MTQGPTLLREWLRRSNMNQKELAPQLGITEAFLSQLLTRKRRAKLEILMQIEYITGVPVSAWADIQVGRMGTSKKVRPIKTNKPDVNLECSELT